jgi:WD40 repeat protein/DNA-binding winged helix-turn-helix (wHTH) protein
VKILRFYRNRRTPAAPLRLASREAAAYNSAKVSPRIQAVLEAGAAFRLGDWLVEPSLNRISRGGEAIQLELKAMDLLVYLAGRAGELVDKREIQDAVCHTEFVSDNTLTRRVAELRDALGDDARNPRYIETVPKRGYRMIARVGPAEEAAETVAPFPFPERTPAEPERGPYPGLAPFTEADAADFFGRGTETAALWRKITNRRLLAVVGPSGAGKSSLLRAGVIARTPAGWRAVVCHPGESPAIELARALAPDLAGNVGEVQELLGFQDADAALAAVSRWRTHWDEALVVVDQFEELFTLSAPRIQEEFVALLRRLVDAAGIHVVLVLRDDFLRHCHRFAELEPILQDLTLVGPPVGAALRRALTEPAARRQYRFESELLVDEMVAEVERERGALPLLAFAASRLWQLRDLKQRLLTREASERIGGVGGALAQHAEATLEGIGRERLPVVRELFRNLVTAQGTRAVREVDELLSVFPEGMREDARSVLATLTDARLLTTFRNEADGGGGRGARVEIVHESLLGAWPRLVRWQAQDAEGALLREQLRQAAALWEARGKPDELLWSGGSYREYRVWRERYRGRLSALEEEFARAMAALAGRRRRRRRVAAAGLFLALAAVAGVVTALWRRAEHQARRVESRRLYEIGRQQIGRSPPEALAYAIASLQIADSTDTRRLALDAIQRSPMPMVIPEPRFPDLPVGVEFSPDGSWLAVSQLNGSIALLDAAGDTVASWKVASRGCRGHFMPDSRAIISFSIGDGLASVWSVPDGALLGRIDGVLRAPVTDISPGDAANIGRGFRLVEARGRPGGWTIDPAPLVHFGLLDVQGAPRVAVDPRSSRVVVAQGREIRLLDAADRPIGDGLLIGSSASDAVQLALDPGGRFIASHGENGEVEMWSLEKSAAAPHHRWQGPVRTSCNDFRFSPSGAFLAACYDDGTALLWEVEGPPAVDPLALHPPGTRMIHIGFHPAGGTVATAGFSAVHLWSVAPGRLSRVLRAHLGEVENLAFGPGGRFLVSAATDGSVRYWPLEPRAGEQPRLLLDWGHPVESVVGWLAVSADGRFAVATGGETAARLVCIDDGSFQVLSSFDQRMYRAAISPAGDTVAALGMLDGQTKVQIIELATGSTTELELPPPEQHSDHITTLQFLADGRLLGSVGGALSEWRPGDKGMRPLVAGAGKFAATPDGRFVIARPNPDRHPPYVATIFDLERGTATELASHGRQVHSLALDPTGTIAVTGGFDGILRVGRATGETPHELVSGSGWVTGVAVSPDGRWIAAGYKDGTIRLWPMPDLDEPPLVSLPHRQFLAFLESLTNLRIVPDPEDPGGSIVDAAAPFPGWKAAAGS